MDTRKLDKWADLLLDTGKRNNLINFKDTRVSTVEVLLIITKNYMPRLQNTIPNFLNGSEDILIKRS